MKIERIDVLAMVEAVAGEAEREVNCIVRVTTDDGITGLGETDSSACVVRAIIETADHGRGRVGLGRVLIGRALEHPSALWDSMYEASRGLGRRGAVIHAMSAIDMALWDIVGQQEGKPVAALLGGVRHDRIPAYATVYPLGETVDSVRRVVDAVLGDTRFPVTALKLAMDHVLNDRPDRVADLVVAVRRHLGGGFALMVDAVEGFGRAETALEVLPALREASVVWFEAPVPLDDIDGLRRLNGHGVAIAAGDTGLTAPAQWPCYFDHGAIDIAQPDIGWCGGFTGMIRIAELARARGRRIIPHGWNTNITLAANLHVLASRERLEPAEVSTSTLPLRWSTTSEPIEIGPDGMIPAPTAPGLGVTLSKDGALAARVR